MSKLMTPANLLILLAASAIAFLPRIWHQPDSAEQLATDKTNLTNILNTTLANDNSTCLTTNHFPLRYDPSKSDRWCEHCELLKSLGLLEKNMLTVTDESGTRFTIDYTLTTEGQAKYKQVTEQQAAFCFGDLVVHKIHWISPAVKHAAINDATTSVAVEYSAEITNASELLYRPEVQEALELAPLTPSPPLLLPTRLIAIGFDQAGKPQSIGEDELLMMLNSRVKLPYSQ